MKVKLTWILGGFILRSHEGEVNMGIGGVYIEIT